MITTVTSPKASELLNINEKKVSEAIQAYLESVCVQSSATGILLGLSGGLDSSVLTTLAARSLGSENVHAAYLYDRDSTQRLHHCARQIADWTGVDFKEFSIDETMQEKGIYQSPGWKTTAISGPLNRMLQRVYCAIFRETPFLSTLRLGNAISKNLDPRSLGLHNLVKFVEDGANARHIQRRLLLEEIARSSRWLLIGAANRSEWLTGWFVKNGIDDLDIQPIKGLYKTQVRQLAAYLSIDEEIIQQPPSPDMIRGITDEFGLGLPYSRLDPILDHLAGGPTQQDLAALGIQKKEIQLVRELHDLSHWKRAPDNQPFAVDGGPGSEYRTGRFHGKVEEKS